MSTIQELDFSVDVLKALLWNYNTAENLQTLLEEKQTWYDGNQSAFWDSWITDVFDLRSCNEFGCVVWAILLGIPLALLNTAKPNSGTPFGFDAFNRSNFFHYNFTSASSAPLIFTLDEQRLILQLRYRQLVSRGTVPEVNKILADLIVPAYGPCYMIDGLNMTQRLVTSFSSPPSLLTILTEFDILPRPGGVLLQTVDSTQPVFGFGSETTVPNTNQNFTHGDFGPLLVSGAGTQPFGVWGKSIFDSGVIWA